MPLTDTGDRIPHPDTLGVNAKAFNENGGVVVVETTTQAVEDCGWPSIISAASEKYDNGDLVSEGPSPRVRIQKSDCTLI